MGHSHQSMRDMGLVWVCAHRRPRVEDPPESLHANTRRPPAGKMGSLQLRSCSQGQPSSRLPQMILLAYCGGLLVHFRWSRCDRSGGESRNALPISLPFCAGGGHIRPVGNPDDHRGVRLPGLLRRGMYGPTHQLCEVPQTVPWNIFVLPCQHPVYGVLRQL